ncbi:YbaK/EbsC family protein [Shimia abyssi]|uniref:Prolyl-tRNA editing enzyme YbaK/EbsC (Cys-tRNA(Pro) deacylase) n=1 Tax=Shimia abyssi TaxID=1662395 RepID=A0A2P8FFK1_9RHOB|nr:YbaK/EbsC family protein [Shimia abyssi]PSL20499.1 prolyl-tRNA editing enzyme YbaK/EbsC (Cys-tRNA(Pro) deacylase) [Shimia abyssi]
MSKSLKRVRAALEAAEIGIDIRETNGARTAQMAADAVGCSLDQIAKSIIFAGQTSREAILFLTAGGNQVDTTKASAIAGEPLGKADAELVRTQTGFAIGGVSPIGHLSPIRAFFDPKLLEFDVVWCAAGTPNHVFPSPPQVLCRLINAQNADFIQ